MVLASLFFLADTHTGSRNSKYLPIPTLPAFVQVGQQTTHTSLIKLVDRDYQLIHTHTNNSLNSALLSTISNILSKQDSSNYWTLRPSTVIITEGDTRHPKSQGFIQMAPEALIMLPFITH